MYKSIKTTMGMGMSENKRRREDIYVRHVKNKANVSNDDDDDNEDACEKKSENIIYEDEDHVYFRSDVSIKSIDKLSKILNKKLKDYKKLKVTCNTCDISPKPIYLHITSYGGDLYAGFLAHDIINNFPIPIYTVIEGYAVSCGSIMSVAGKKRYITPNSHMLIHQLSSATWGTFDEMHDEHKNLETNMEQLYKIYGDASNKKLNKKKLQEILKHDIYWNFDMCNKYGLVDELWINKIEN
jgi:ATP-dependent protease ClpP protease subunit